MKTKYAGCNADGHHSYRPAAAPNKGQATSWRLSLHGDASTILDGCGNPLDGGQLEQIVREHNSHAALVEALGDCLDAMVVGGVPIRGFWDVAAKASAALALAEA